MWKIVTVTDKWVSVRTPRGSGDQVKVWHSRKWPVPRCSTNDPTLALFVTWAPLPSHRALWTLKQVPIRLGTVLTVEIFHQCVASSDHSPPFLVHVVPQMQCVGVVEARLCVPGFIVAPPRCIGDGIKSLGV